MSIMENIIWPLKPDIFVTTWDDQPSYDFCKHYNPVKRNILNFNQVMKLFGSMDKLDYEPNIGLILHAGGLKACHTLYYNHKLLKKLDYDLIIRLRPDVQVLEPIKIHEKNDCIKNKLIRLPLFESENIYNHEEELKKQFSFSFVYENNPYQIKLMINLPLDIQIKWINIFNCLSFLRQAIKIMGRRIPRIYDKGS